MAASLDYFEANFDQTFYCHVEGLITTGHMDFGFKPAALIGYDLFYENTVKGVHSFTDFISHLTQIKPDRLQSFFSRYVQHSRKSLSALLTLLESLSRSSGPSSSLSAADLKVKTSLRKLRDSFKFDCTPAFQAVVTEALKDQPPFEDSEALEDFKLSLYGKTSFETLLKSSGDLSEKQPKENPATLLEAVR